MKFNIKKLRSAWMEQDKSTKHIAELIGVNYQSFVDKIAGRKGNGEITATQLAIICNDLNRNMEDFIDTEE